MRHGSMGRGWKAGLLALFVCTSCVLPLGLAQAAESPAAQIRHFTHEQQLQVGADQYTGDNGTSFFPSSSNVDEDGFEGDIPLADVSAVPIYASQSGQVDRTVVFSGLIDNDVTKLPTEQEFTVSSDAAPGATTEATLKRAEVSYAVEGYDDTGLPTGYTATVTYRGSESGQYISGYALTALYEGDVEAAVVPVVSVTGTEPEDEVIADDPTPEGAPAMNPLLRLLENSGPWALIMCAGILAAFVTAGVALRRNQLNGRRGDA